jgi:hypothetical protein
MSHQSRILQTKIRALLSRLDLKRTLLLTNINLIGKDPSGYFDILYIYLFGNKVSFVDHHKSKIFMIFAFLLIRVIAGRQTKSENSAKVPFSNLPTLLLSKTFTKKRRKFFFDYSGRISTSKVEFCFYILGGNSTLKVEFLLGVKFRFFKRINTSIYV